MLFDFVWEPWNEPVPAGEGLRYVCVKDRKLLGAVFPANEQLEKAYRASGGRGYFRVEVNFSGLLLVEIPEDAPEKTLDAFVIELSNMAGQ